MYRGLMILVLTVGMAGCSQPAVVIHNAAAHYVSKTIDIGGEWTAERPLVDQFAKDGPYSHVDVIAPSEEDGRLVVRWLREAGVDHIAVRASGRPDMITLTGYYGGH